MYPRLRLDIDWKDLAYAAGQCLAPRSRQRLQDRLERAWSQHGDALACLSVRTGFDLLLRACAFPRGSEVLVSAVTIRDMAGIIEHHGLVPVPVDIDPRTLAVSPEQLERAAGPRTVAVLIAHLFGTRNCLATIAAFARRRALLLFEDCAQAYTADEYRGHPAADVSMFSFGPIKTATALGGALLRIRDLQLLQRVRAAHAEYPLQSRWWFLRRVAKFSMLKLLSNPRLYGCLAKGCQAVGRNHDQLVNRSVKGFNGPNFFGRIRRRPSVPLLALIGRRVSRYSAAAVERRAAAGDRLYAALRGGPSRLPGEGAALQTHWVAPISVADPLGLVNELRQAGFDATMAASNMVALEPPAERPECDTPQATALLSGFVYLPAYPQMPAAELDRLIAVIRRWQLSAETKVLPQPPAAPWAWEKDEGGRLKDELAEAVR